jgi:tRNA threonylcarbamoyladenosine biosynthesis protein TsaB
MPLMAALQAGRGRIAVERYGPAAAHRPDETAWVSQGPAEITTADTLADSIDTPTLVVGELTAGERQRLIRKKVNVVLASPSMCVRRPSVLAQLAWRRWQEGRLDDPSSLAPIYLQLPQPAAT